MSVVRRALTGLLGILASLAGMVAVSSATGGPLTWVVTEGSSMLPQITPGTLAVLQRRPAYEVGDVVGYRNADLASQVVLHRVIEVDGAKLRLQGDNNGWADPYRPTPEEVLGEQLFALPAIGRALDLVRDPVPIAVLGGVVTLLVLRGSPSGRRRSSGGRNRAPAVRVPEPRRAAGPPPIVLRTAPRPDARDVLPRSPRPGGSWQDGVAPRLAPHHEPLVLPSAVRDVAAVGLIACLLALSATALLPTAQTTREDQPVQASVAFGYRATAAPSVVYADGVVSTEEPVFLDVVDEVLLDADLDVVLPVGAAAAGTWRLLLDVADATGWSTTAHVGQPVPLGQRHQEVRVRPRDLLALADSAAALTGLEPGVRTLRLRAQVSATASRGSTSVPLRAEPALDLQLEPKVLRLAPEATLTGGADAALPAPLPVGGERVRLGPVQLPTVPTRAVALVLGAGCLLLLLAVGATVPWTDEAAALRRRHPGLLVPTGPLRLDGPVVEVDDLAARARIASRYERFVMVSEEDGQRVFVVQDDGTTYRYCSRSRASSPVVVPAQRGPAEQEQVST